MVKADDIFAEHKEMKKEIMTNSSVNKMNWKRRCVLVQIWAKSQI